MNNLLFQLLLKAFCHSVIHSFQLFDRLGYEPPGLDATCAGVEDVDNFSVTGVKRTTFEKMLEIIRVAYQAKHMRRGRKPKLEIADMLLATLEYLREYRTYAHIAANYGIAESNLYRTVKWVEDTLIKDGTFSLPGRKALLKSDMEFEVVLIDSTETPIERPKRGKNSSTLGRKSDTQ